MKAGSAKVALNKEYHFLPFALVVTFYTQYILAQ